MNNIYVRIIMIALALFGVYKMFPQISGPVDYYLQQPKFQNDLIAPAIETANKVLPDKLQLPTPSRVMGISSDMPNNSPVQQLTEEVSRQAASMAADQIDQIRKSATDAFCSTLIEKLKSECGVDQAP